MKIVIISSSLSKKSSSLVLGEFARQYLNEKNIDTEIIDLRNYDLPVCDGEETFDHPHVQSIKNILKTADAFIISTPIYNYDANSAIKNLIELSGNVWVDKIVGFLCSAGGQNSYMSILALANSMMLDFRCVIVPRFVYAAGSSFDDNKTIITDAKIKDRIIQLSDKLIQLTGFAAD
ncbi:MAG: NAD(P)H-dependent oxidoreductase [Calditrichaeota bacterium]|nr:NAD(P)H-dependent oxidoreductase [Calditrichota bacterium]